jgi:hypothetical protein
MRLSKAKISDPEAKKCRNAERRAKRVPARLVPRLGRLCVSFATPDTWFTYIYFIREPYECAVKEFFRISSRIIGPKPPDNARIAAGPDFGDGTISSCDSFHNPAHSAEMLALNPQVYSRASS